MSGSAPARRARGAASTRCSRPTAWGRAWRGGDSSTRRPTAGCRPTRSTTSARRSRLHRRDLGRVGRGLRRRAVARAGRARAAAAEPGADARRRPAGAAPSRYAPRPPPSGAAARAARRARGEPEAARRLPPDCLSLVDELECLAFVPDPEGPAAAPSSSVRARRPRPRGRLDGGGAITAAGALRAAPAAVGALDPDTSSSPASTSRRCSSAPRPSSPRAALAPARSLDGERPASRTRLVETLRAYLDEPGQPLRIAQRLGVHPQTVRYRLRRLRDLLPPGALDDPDRRSPWRSPCARRRTVDGRPAPARVPHGARARRRGHDEPMSDAPARQRLSAFRRPARRARALRLGRRGRELSPAISCPAGLLPAHARPPRPRRGGRARVLRPGAGTVRKHDRPSTSRHCSSPSRATAARSCSTRRRTRGRRRARRAGRRVGRDPQLRGLVGSWAPCRSTSGGAAAGPARRAHRGGDRDDRRRAQGQVAALVGQARLAVAGIEKAGDWHCAQAVAELAGNEATRAARRRAATSPMRSVQRLPATLASSAGCWR